MSLMNKLTRFARSPQGRKAVDSATRYASSPKGKAKIDQVRRQLSSRGAGKRRPR